MSELRNLRSFVTVAEELHFGHAAKRLFITQPALSTQIARLEAEIGVQLFDRTRRSIELTDSGRALYESAVEALRIADEGIARAVQAASGETGVIDLAYAPAAAFDVLPWLLSNWVRDHPQITLQLREMRSRDQIPALIGHELQVGIVQSQLAHPELSSLTIRRDPAVVALPAHHRLARRRQIDLNELTPEHMMVLPRTAAPAFYSIFESAGSIAGQRPRLHDVHGGLPRMMALVAAGQGVALTHAGLTAWKPPGVVFVRLASSITIDTAVAWRSGSTSKLVQRFIDWISQQQA
jgi:DNA-binding transcriptional LysR family regulator